jgi:CRP-like cAMP-binding protein
MTIYKFQEKKYIQLLNSSPLFSLDLAKYQAKKLRNLNQRFTIQKGDATTRYLDAFAYLAKKTSLLSSINSTVPKTLQKEIASIAGLSRETASRTLTKLKTRGIIIESEIGLRIEDENSLVKRGITY